MAGRWSTANDVAVRADSPTHTTPMLNLLLVEDNANLRAALKTGLESTGQIAVAFACASGEDAISYCLTAGAREAVPDVALMDVQLAGDRNGLPAPCPPPPHFPPFP